MAGKAWRQEREAVGHLAATVKKQREKAIALCIPPRTPAHGMVPPAFRVGPPSPVNTTWNLLLGDSRSYQVGDTNHPACLLLE